MEVSAKHEGQTLTFFLVGELDHHGAKGLLENLEREIERTLPLSLVLDFSGVTFMDSSGIAVALRGWQRDAGAGRRRNAVSCGAAAKKGVRSVRRRTHGDDRLRREYII